VEGVAAVDAPEAADRFFGKRKVLSYRFSLPPQVAPESRFSKKKVLPPFTYPPIDPLLLFFV